MNIITLRKLDHVYTNITTNEIYNSESDVVSFFREPFDPDYWSRRKAYQDLVPGFPSIAAKYKEGDYALFDELDKFLINKDLFNIYVNNYKKTWKKKSTSAADRGTAIHEMMENEDIKRGYAINPVDNKPYKVYTNETIDIYNLRPGCYLEIALHDPLHKIAGTPDKFFLVPIAGELYVDQFDYKSNEDIMKKSFKEKKFLKPFNKVFDNKINGYTFAMSGYHYMLSLLGCIPRNSFIITARDIEKMGTIKIPIWLEEAALMHKTYFQKKSIDK